MKSLNLRAGTSFHDHGTERRGSLMSKKFLKVIATATMLLGLTSTYAEQIQAQIFQHPISPSLVAELWETRPDTAGRFLPNGTPTTWGSLCGDFTKYPYDCNMIELIAVDLEPPVPNERTNRLSSQQRVKIVNAKERFSSSGFIAFREGKAIALRVDQYLELDAELHPDAFSDVVVRAKAAGWNPVPKKPPTSADSADQQVRAFEAGNTKVELVRQKNRLILFYSKAR